MFFLSSHYYYSHKSNGKAVKSNPSLTYLSAMQKAEQRSWTWVVLFSLKRTYNLIFKWETHLIMNTKEILLSDRRELTKMSNFSFVRGRKWNCRRWMGERKLQECKSKWNYLSERVLEWFSFLNDESTKHCLDKEIKVTNPNLGIYRGPFEIICLLT